MNSLDFRPLAPNGFKLEVTEWDRQRLLEWRRSEENDINSGPIDSCEEGTQLVFKRR